MSLHFDSTYKLIQKGQEGNPVGIPYPFPRLDEHLFLGKAMYITVAGMSGTGKTGFADECFIRHPYAWIKEHPEKEIDLKVFAFKMERPKIFTVAKWICGLLWEQEQVLVDVKRLLGWKGPPLESELLKKVEEYRRYFAGLFEKVELIDTRQEPDDIYKRLRRYARATGKEYDEYGAEITDQRLAEASRKGERIPVWDYQPDDPRRIVIVELDHMGLILKVLGAKETIDQTSNYFQIFRDRYGFTIAALIQFNRNIREMSRRTKGTIQPEEQDFEGSSRPFQDCDVSFAILNPYKFDLKEYLGYKLLQMRSEEGKNRFRSVSLLKNTYGDDDVHMGAQFIGELGVFRELPRPDAMTIDDYYYWANLKARPSIADWARQRGVEFG